MNPAINALDRLHEITLCIEAVGDLLIPEKDLHVVDRDKQAVLINHLARELIAAHNQLNQTWPR
ncbi:MAG: hypothetical protein BVN35_09515 [Proteobacteria bacterium ST_bin11]|nr:MAG: hypothetical protein BVN35_09515 [Proteobacteria bacterium ST_bin11]